MRISHIAIRAENIELLKNFYVKYFDLKPGPKYYNEKKNFTSYFLFTSGEDTAIELIHQPGTEKVFHNSDRNAGFAHIAISLGSREEVDTMTERFRSGGHPVLSEPRVTGDGYYESVISDPEGNLIELTA